MNNKKMSVEYDLFADFGTVDESNIVAGAVMQAVDETQNREPTKKSQRIEDFGEKIGGARKDLYAAYCDLMKVPIESEVEGVPLSKSVFCAICRLYRTNARRKILREQVN